MIRGTTPTNVFTTNVDLTGAKIFLTYSQFGKTVFEKTEDDITIETITGETPEYKLSVTLTQEDTLLLASDAIVNMQIRAIFENGNAIASDIMEATVGSILKNGEIEYES